MSCVFCPDNWGNLDIVTVIDKLCAVVRPLDPVTEGHVLVIHPVHTDNFAQSEYVAQDLASAAAIYAQDHVEQANIITSIGPAATQTVFHTHLHIVPRRLNDDLPLPWTPQQMDRERWRRALATTKELGATVAE